MGMTLQVGYFENKGMIVCIYALKTRNKVVPFERVR